MIKDIIDKITSETTIDEIMPSLVEMGTREDELENRITELENDVVARDEEIRNLKDTNFELMKKIFDKPIVKDEETEVEEKIEDKDIFEEMLE